MPVLVEEHVIHITNNERPAPLLGSTWQAVDDWTLVAGLEVAVHDSDKMVDRGTVETVTRDGAVLWLKQEGPVLRRAVENIPGRNLQVLIPICHSGVMQPSEVPTRCLLVCGCRTSVRVP